MNHIFLSGIAESAPVLLSKDNQTPHACMLLVVSHRNSSGVEKREIYPIHTWHNVAQSLMKVVTPSKQVSIKGYICQKHVDNCTQLYITAEEFHVSATHANRPARRKSSIPSTVSEKNGEFLHSDDASTICEAAEDLSNETE